MSVRILVSLSKSPIIVCTFVMLLKKVALNNMLNLLYFNGFFDEASLKSLNDFEQVRNAIIVAKCEGVPFRGKPVDMANNAIAHILKRTSSELGAFPVVLQSNSGTDGEGDYTNEVVFQVVV